MQRVLITGIAGVQAQLLARRLAREASVSGVDQLEWRDASAGIRVHRADLRKRRFEEVVRSERPQAVVHMGFLRRFSSDETLRHDVNVRGTKKLLDHCVKYGVERLVVVSSSAVYGAFAQNPFHMDEEFPLSASRGYPEIRDQVEVDTLCTAFTWQHPEVQTCVLRPVNVLGAHAHSMLASYLLLPRVPTVMGFDPMMQLIDEEDLGRAIELALGADLRGVFNVVGSGEVPIHTAIEAVGATAWPLPGPLAHVVAKRLFDWGVWRYPPGVLDYLRYPVSVSGKRFARATGYEPCVSLAEMLATMRERR